MDRRYERQHPWSTDRRSGRRVFDPYGRHREDDADDTAHGGRGDYGDRQPVREGRFWHGDYNPYADTGDRSWEWEQGPYHGALGYRDEVSRDPPRFTRETGGGVGGRAPDWGDPGAYRTAQDQPLRRGPKGYQRSDERIREEVCERLAGAEYVDVSDVSVDVREGKVTLEGTVPQRRMKHWIEDIVDAVYGVQDVENRIRVRRDGAERDEKNPLDYSSGES